MFRAGEVEGDEDLPPLSPYPDDMAEGFVSSERRVRRRGLLERELGFGVTGALALRLDGRAHRLSLRITSSRLESVIQETDKPQF